MDRQDLRFSFKPMAYQCDICSKKAYAGRQHTHHAGVAGGQWKKRAPITKRSFKPNLHTATLPINGVMTRVRACTDCIKRVKFDLLRAKTSQAAA